ncbi:hypothetical protein ACH5RR_018497 [Cinchona calisaya]|uniref:Uncharacterized protein n=1 Tax=Cinchona calisaya TaxID=153742 RepID=A0ABD2ZM38_9GENT
MDLGFQNLVQNPIAFPSLSGFIAGLANPSLCSSVSEGSCYLLLLRIGEEAKKVAEVGPTSLELAENQQDQVVEAVVEGLAEVSSESKYVVEQVQMTDVQIEVPSSDIQEANSFEILNSLSSEFEQFVLTSHMDAIVELPKKHNIGNKGGAKRILK